MLETVLHEERKRRLPNYHDDKNILNKLTLKIDR